MKIVKYAKALTGLLMFVSLAANANILTVSGHTFDDLGGSTVDLSTHLEWRDINLTNGRSLCSVAKDTGGPVPAGCSSFDNQNLIPNSDGWRYATRGEVAQLMTDWMGIPVGPHGGYSLNTGVATEFLSVFANTGAGSYIRPDFLPDTGNPIQSVGFYVTNSFLSMDFYNGNINGSCCGQGSVLVRQSAVNVPEPAPLALMAIAIAGLGYTRRRRG